MKKITDFFDHFKNASAVPDRYNIHKKNTFFIYFTITLLALIVFAFSVQNLPSENLFFADTIGKWMQIDAFNQTGNFRCLYKESFDPSFQFIPGPWYFYSIQKGECIYGYQAIYALIASPFVRIHPTGYFVLHFIFYLLYIFGFISATKKLLPGRKLLVWIAAASGGLVIPSLVFAMDLSEVILSLTLGIWALALIAKEENFQPFHLSDMFQISLYKHIDVGAILSGICMGLLFALRTESIITSFFMAVAIFLLQRKIFLSWTSGFLSAFFIVILYHLWIYGSAMGIRGASHAELTANQNFTQHLSIASILLLGGPLGLFTSLPEIMFGLLALFPSTFNKHSSKILFYGIVSIFPAIVIVLTAPGDGGYSWGARFLALTFAPFFMLTLIAMDHPFFKKWYGILLILIMILYGFSYTMKGKDVFRRAIFQNYKYTKYLNTVRPDAIVTAQEPLIGLLSTRYVSGRVYQCGNDPCIQKLSPHLINAGLQKIVLIRFYISLLKDIPGWKETGRLSVDQLEFVTYER